MSDIIKFTEKAYLKLISAYFRPIKGNWMFTYIRWLIDSKYRLYMCLNAFLKEQLTNPNEILVKKASEFKKYSFDKRIVEILKFVHKTVRYMYDKQNYGYLEKWATAIETLSRKKDDCDGINNLIYILARLSGIPAFSIYCTIGDTSVGGHFWLLYLYTKKGKVVSIDGTYYVDTREMRYRPEFKLNESRYRKIWYVFNDKFTFREKNG